MPAYLQRKAVLPNCIFVVDVFLLERGLWVPSPSYCLTQTGQSSYAKESKGPRSASPPFAFHARPYRKHGLALTRLGQVEPSPSSFLSRQHLLQGK